MIRSRPLTLEKCRKHSHIGHWKTNKVTHNTMPNTPIYKIIFFNMGQIYEIYARHIYQSDVYGFIEIEELVFGERSQMLVDPSEERLKSEFEGVNRSYIPIHSVARIDEVDKEGIGKISEAKGGNIAPFPMPAFKPKGSDS